MSKRLLILTPNPKHASYHGRWPYVLAAYHEALAGLDVEVFDAPWSEPLTRTYDLVCPLVAWGYHNTPDAFVAALKAMQDDGLRVFNPADIVGWNVDKRYLLDLAGAGVRIVPTLFTDRITTDDLARARVDFGQASLVVKPVFSAGAKRTLVWEGDDVPADGPEGLAMIQPFMSAIQDEGEWSLLFFAGEFSHAVLKTPKSGDFRSQPDYDAHLCIQVPPKEAFELARAAIDFIGGDQLLYARVDMVRAVDGGMCLMELELIEPDLYLNYDLEASMRFKDAVELALHPAQCGCGHGH